MRIALYARVSKPPRGAVTEQMKRDQNPEVQLVPMREWSGIQKHKLAAEYVDRQSGKNALRPQLQKLLRDVAKGLIDVDAVVVWRLDRFGRSAQDLYNLVAELKDHNVSFISLNEGFDLTTPAGKLIFGVMASFAEFERALISDRTKMGLALAKAEGRIPGRKIDPKRGPSRTTLWRRSRHQAA